MSEINLYDFSHFDSDSQHEEIFDQVSLRSSKVGFVKDFSWLDFLADIKDTEGLIFSSGSVQLSSMPHFEVNPVGSTDQERDSLFNQETAQKQANSSTGVLFWKTESPTKIDGDGIGILKRKHSEQSIVLSNEPVKARRSARQAASALNNKSKAAKAAKAIQAARQRVSVSKQKQVHPVATATISRRNRNQEQASDADEPVTRWSKDDDVVLFRAFKDLIAQRNLTEADFYGLRGRMPEAEKDVLAALVIECNWKGHVYSLRTRIQKIMKSQDFTARETRRLKRLLKLERKGIVPLNYVAEQFPGKSLDTIEMYRQMYMPRSRRDQCA